MAIFEIKLYVSETSEEMAYQLLALAIKKKFKKQVRPCFTSPDYEWSPIIQIKEKQNELWRAKCGQNYDY